MTLLDDVWSTIVADIAAGRSMEPEQMAGILEQGPHNAEQAVERGLADAVIYEDELERTLEDLTGRKVLIDRQPFDTPVKPDQWGPGPDRVGVIVVGGPLVEGESTHVPLLGISTVGDETIVDALDDARKNPQIAAVVLRVESGGGSALASDRIWRAVLRLARKKPVVASFGGVAASGGYYIAAPAAEIVTSPSTVTGSIGLFYGKADLSGLLDKFDVDVTVLEQGGEKVDMESWYRPYTDEEVAFLEEQLEHFYNLFLERVAAGRDMSREQVHEVARGRVWSGECARQRGLVDSNGGLVHAIARARALGGVPSWVPVDDLTPGPGLLAKLISKLASGSDGASLPDLAAMLARAAGLDELFPTAMFLLREEETPLALAPLTLAL
jgi:protease-4